MSNKVTEHACNAKGAGRKQWTRQKELLVPPFSAHEYACVIRVSCSRHFTHCLLNHCNFIAKGENENWLDVEPLRADNYLTGSTSCFLHFAMIQFCGENNCRSQCWGRIRRRCKEGVRQKLPHRDKKRIQLNWIFCMRSLWLEAI